MIGFDIVSNPIFKINQEAANIAFHNFFQPFLLAGTFLMMVGFSNGLYLKNYLISERLVERNDIREVLKKRCCTVVCLLINV